MTTANTLAALVNSSSQVVVPSGGVNFGIDTDGSGAVTGGVLDDYEEGTWTPTVSAGVTTPGYSVQRGNYTKVGNIVTVNFSIRLNSGTLNSNQIKISGLPFLLQDNADAGSGGAFVFAYTTIITSSSTNLPYLYGDRDSSDISFYDTDGTSFIGTDSATTNFRTDISGTYLTN